MREERSRYITTKDVQEILHLSSTSVSKLVQMDGFPSLKIGKNYIIDETKMYEWVDSHMGTSVSLN